MNCVTRPAGFSAIASGLAILIGLQFTVLPVARAAGDDPQVNIATRKRPANEPKSRPRSIRVDVNLVLIPVLVTDPYERPVRGLQKTDFHLFEDGVEREISQFFSEESPISIGIIFDTSTSMRRKMDESRKAVSEFLKMSVAGDEFFLIQFNDKPQQVEGFTTDPQDIEDSLPKLQAEGWTALYDAIYLGIHKMKKAANGRKVLLVLSDGGDNDSRFTEGEITSLVKEADVRIFSISILDRSRSLENIAGESGGRAFRVRKLDELPELAGKVSAELHSEYVLGYVPEERLPDGKYRKVKVEVKQPSAEGPRLRTSWKRGYYSLAP